MPRDLTGGEAAHGSEGDNATADDDVEIGVGAEEVEAQRVVGARDRAARRFGVESDLSVVA